MQTKFQMTKPGDAEVMMQITMTLDEWIEIRSQLLKGYVASKLSSAISDVVHQATKVFMPSTQPDETT